MADPFYCYCHKQLLLLRSCMHSMEGSGSVIFPMQVPWAKLGLCLLIYSMEGLNPTSKVFSIFDCSYISVVMARYILIASCCLQNVTFPPTISIKPLAPLPGAVQSHAPGKWLRNFIWPRDPSTWTIFQRESSWICSLSRFSLDEWKGR